MDTSTITALGFGALLMLGAACSGPERNDEGAIVEQGTLDVFDIKVGDCLSGATEGEVANVAAIPCDQPHMYQAYASFDVPDSAYPSSGELQDVADQGCFDAFEEFVGVPYSDSIYLYTWMEPTTESWQDDDREILCQLMLEEGELTEDAQGSGV